MHPPNESTDSTGEPPGLDAEEPPVLDHDHDRTTDQSNPDPEDSRTADSPTDEFRAGDQPFCRVFGGPTSHRVQFTGPESQPATAIDREQNRRTPTAEPRENDAETDPVQSAIETVQDRFVELERALEPVRGAIECGRSPNPTDVREARAKMVQLKVTVEEELAPLCPGAEPWELSDEHVPGPQLVGVAEASEEIQQLVRERGEQDGSN